MKAQTPADAVFIAVVEGLMGSKSGQEGLAGEDAANTAGPQPTSELHSVGNLGACEWT